jgi:predicted RNA-binding Zn-ribbon protein involved in translation (DUF1610 family)
MLMEESLSKEKIVTYIIEKVEDLGFSVEKRRVLSFIENFHEKFNRLPSNNEIKPIILSYMKICKEEEDNQLEETIQKLDEQDFNHGIFNKDLYKDMLNGFIPHGDMLIIPKPEGRRVCPICGDSNLYKIHEMTDKSDLLCDYPRIYGKKYLCDQCGMQWKEK